MIKKLVNFAAIAIVTLTTYLLVENSAAATEVTLYKNPQCGCCENYADYLRESGFTVNVIPTHELVPMSETAGIPENFQGCHLAYIENYFVSGHVPINAVKKLLTDKPDIKGITLPGMPTGSPGMNGQKLEPFKIYQISGDKPTLFATE